MKKTYPQLNEEVYTQTLENGLHVVLVPKKGFKKIYSVFTTNYGSIDETFIPLGQKERIRVPEGIAHFLEHKMFEKKQGDVFQEFSKYGAFANAFTSFTKTSYLFSTTSYLNENLALLLDFVQTPYFTKESVEKEKGIIGQEIQMYQDEPNWRLFCSLLQNLYPKHPLHIDIAGTKESIANITAEDLYMCYNTFYHPSNMTLLVVGNIHPKEILSFITDNQAQKKYTKQKEITRFFEDTTEAIVKESELEMDVTMPKFALGIKGDPHFSLQGKEELNYKLMGSFFFELILGQGSQLYQQLYNKGWIDDSFGYDFTVDRTFHFGSISGDTTKIKELKACLMTYLFEHKYTVELTDEAIARIKKRRLGKYLQALNSVENIALQFFQSTNKEMTLFDLPNCIEELTRSDFMTFGKQFLKNDQMTFSIIKPKKD